MSVLIFLKLFPGKYSVFSFLKRERERFPLFAPMRYCVPPFLDRSALQPFLTALNGPERSMIVP